MALAYVFSVASLQSCLLSALPSWFNKMSGEECVEWQVQRIELDEVIYFVHDSDETSSRRIIIFDQESHGVANSRWMKKNVLERVHRASIVAGMSRTSLPHEWHTYHHNNLLAFFASSRWRGEKVMRWTAEVRPLNSYDVVFWLLKPAKQVLPLEDFRSDYSLYESVVLFWDDAIAEAARRFRQESPRPAQSVQPMVALEATFDATSRGRTYSEWLNHLSVDQLRFLERRPPVKLRGPAGTGKTLCLLLRAIQEVKNARESGRECRVLFLTHSWAMQAQVDHLLSKMGEDQATRDIDVFPLFSAGSLLLNSKFPPGLQTLGEDSHTGKQEQLSRIRDLLDRSVGDWAAYRSRCRPEFVAAVESDRDSDERRLFEWEILNEFSCVLIPEGIVARGYNADQVYRSLRRSDWMMSLETDGEKDFILGLYGDFVDGLRKDRLISADQVISDFVKDLEKSTWQYQRVLDGYDLVFVDELHLFNEQERRALHHLTRDPSTYPKMFMALDPRQSAELVYTGVSGRAITKDDSEGSSGEMVDVAQLSLSKVHRFGGEVLALLRHINRSWPQLDLGEDWELDMDQIEADMRSANLPKIFRHSAQRDEALAAMRSGRNWSLRPDGGRVAVVLVDGDALDIYEQTAESGDFGRTNVLRSRDDVASLQYEKRTIVLSSAEYVAGLQFDTVVVAGLPRYRRNASWPQTRFLLSQLYLAISRASSHIEIHVNVARGGLPDVLDSAVKAGVLEISQE